jgi:hypothetical protein
MPYNRISAAGVQHGVVSDEEQFNARNAQAAAARQAQMAALQAQMQASAQSNDTARYGIDAGLKQNMMMADRDDMRLDKQLGAQSGMFDKQAGLSRDLDRSSTDRAFGLANINMGAALGRDRREQAMFDEEAPIRQAKSRFQMQALNGGAGAGGQDDLIRYAMAMGQDPSPFLHAQNDERQFQRQGQQSQQAAMLALIPVLAQKDPAAAAKLLSSIPGYEGIDLTSITPAFEAARPKFGNPDTALGDLGTATTAFGKQDAATVGWDPGEGDVSRIDEMAKNAVGLLVRDYGMSEQEAVAIVNRKIQDSVAGSQNSLGTGWIERLKQQRGIQ